MLKITFERTPFILNHSKGIWKIPTKWCSHPNVFIQMRQGSENIGNFLIVKHFLNYKTIKLSREHITYKVMVRVDFVRIYKLESTEGWFISLLVHELQAIGLPCRHKSKLT